MFLYKSLKQRDEEEDVQVGLAVSWLALALLSSRKPRQWSGSLALLGGCCCYLAHRCALAAAGAVGT